MSEQFTSKYRPKSFHDMVGQTLNAVVLQQMVNTGSVPSALLFRGPRGTGKTTAARILAMELNPLERESILRGTSISVIEIDAASNGSVADIRALTEQLEYNVGAENRVVILDEAHSITRDGFNALLKTLEEPPAGVVFVLVTTEPNKIPETILSRVTEFEFRRVSPRDIHTRLAQIATKESLPLPPELLERIAETCDGSVRDAIKMLDFSARTGTETVEQFDEFFGVKDYGPDLFAALLTNDHSKIFAQLDRILQDTGDYRLVTTVLADTFRDIFVLKAGGEVSASGDSLRKRVLLAKAAPTNPMYPAVQVLWDLKTKVRWSEDQRAALELALVLVADKLTEGQSRTVGRVEQSDQSVTPVAVPTSPVASKEDEPRELSLSELMM